VTVALIFGIESLTPYCANMESHTRQQHFTTRKPVAK